MNTCFRVADQLADSLRCLSSGFSEAEVLPLLSEFDARFEQELIPRLAENHAAGLQMDTIAGGGFVDLQGAITLAAGDERILGAMALKAAGLECLRMCGRYTLSVSNKPAVAKLGLQTRTVSILLRNRRW